MSEASYNRLFGPLVIVGLGASFYALLLWTAVPHDLPGYWPAFFSVRAGQVAGFALATSFYVAGLGLCLVAFSSRLPIRSLSVRGFLSVPGVLSLGSGAVYIWVLLVSFTDKVR